MSKGKLFYVVGSSGVGKDTLMDYAKQRLDIAEVKFVQRYITRPASAGGEAHIELTKETFKDKLKDAFFCMWWESHGNYYGVCREIEDWMAEGSNVVMNGSRGYLPIAIEKYPDMITVLIEASESILRKRLHQRGRESAEDIEKRIQRARKFHSFTAPNLIRLNNDVPLEESGAAFINIIAG